MPTRACMDERVSTDVVRDSRFIVAMYIVFNYFQKSGFHLELLTKIIFFEISNDLPLLVI